MEKQAPCRRSASTGRPQSCGSRCAAFWRSERIARENGLTPRQYLLLLAIRSGDPDRRYASTSELVERLQLSQGTVTDVLARAEQAGLVTREAAANDARVTWLRLTSLGEERLAKVLGATGPERAALIGLVRDLS